MSCPTPFPHESGGTVSSGPARILSIEDNPADVRLLRQALLEQQIAFELTTLADGIQAMAYAAQVDPELKRPDLIVLDLNLPAHNGLEILAHLKANPVLSPIPVVVLTTSAERNDRQEALRLGATLFLQKPSDLDEFLRLGEPLIELCAKPPGDL